MKKTLISALTLLLALCLIAAPALAAEEDWTFRSDRYGFSFTLPEELAKDIVIEEYTADTLYVHTPAEGGWSVDEGRPWNGTAEDADPTKAAGVFLFRYAPAMVEVGWGGNLGTLRVKTRRNISPPTPPCTRRCRKP